MRPHKQREYDKQLVAILNTTHAQHPHYGVRRLAIHLGWSQNKVRRVRRLAGIVIEVPGKKYRGKHRGKAEIHAPQNILHRYAQFKDELRPQDGMDYSAMVNAEAWAQDFTHVWFQRSWHYLAVVISLKTREVVGWRLGLRHTSELTHEALLDALSKHDSPAILHSDQGSEYLSYKHQLLCQRMEIQLSCSNKSSPWQNGYMERWFGSFKREFNNPNQYTDLPQLHEAIALHIHYYNTKRIHLALGMSPAAYAAKLNT